MFLSFQEQNDYDSNTEEDIGQDVDDINSIVIAIITSIQESRNVWLSLITFIYIIYFMSLCFLVKSCTVK